MCIGERIVCLHLIVCSTDPWFCIVARSSTCCCCFYPHHNYHNQWPLNGQTFALEGLTCRSSMAAALSSPLMHVAGHGSSVWTTNNCRRWTHDRVEVEGIKIMQQSSSVEFANAFEEQSVIAYLQQQFRVNYWPISLTGISLAFLVHIQRRGWWNPGAHCDNHLESWLDRKHKLINGWTWTGFACSTF